MSALLPLTHDLLSQTLDGLIFSPPLVPPVLDGRKTVTRRMSKKWLRRKKGDLLFVRENWSLTGWDCTTVRLVDRPGAIESWTAFVRCPPEAGDWFFRESERTKAWWAKHGRHSAPLRPSLLLPRWASRCVLRLTEEPRVERVQDITEEECVREGMALPPADAPRCPCEGEEEEPGPHLPHCLWRQQHVEPDEVGPYVAQFVCTWTALHTKPGERWEDNPEVVRLAFERVA